MDHQKSCSYPVCQVFIPILIGLLLSFLPGATRAQLAEEAWLEALWELMPEDQVEEAELTELQEIWQQVRLQPIDINRATWEDLASLGILSPVLIRRILDYREQTGGFIAVQELQVIPGLGLAAAQLLAEILTVAGASTLSTVTYEELMRKGKHEWLLRHSRVLEKQQGYQINDTERSRYLGSPDRLLLRYRYHYGSDFLVSMNMEKDPGEQFFRGAQSWGFDYYSLSVQVKNQGRLTNLVLGDYALQFGQGLGVWTGYSPGGKGAMMHGIARQGAGLRPHTSANEVDYFRGVAATLYQAGIHWTPFISYRKRDASLNREVEEGLPIATGLGTSGLHRTPSEVRGRGQVPQFTYGLNAEYRATLWRVGATVYRSSLGANIQPQPLLRNHFAFRGSDLMHASLYHSLSIRQAFLFGEVAFNPSGGWASLQGALLSLHPHVSLGLLHRYYTRDHHAFYAQAFGEGSNTQNEQGFYAGIDYQPSRRVSWVFYSDYFRFPWVRYRVDAPSRGVDVLTQFTYTWSRRKHLSLRIRYREKQENLSTEDPMPYLAQTQRLQARLHFDTRWGDRWRFRYRVEGVRYEKELESPQIGWMIYQDVFYQPMGAVLTGNFRLALFGTHSYDSRIYAFENDVLFASSFPVYHNRGLRSYINMRWKISSRLDLWLRYSVFRYHGDTPVGSGLDLIGRGRTRSEIKSQMRFRIL